MNMNRQVVYVIKLDKTPLIYAILPSSVTPSWTVVPLPNLLALLNLCLHNNLIFQDEVPIYIRDSWLPFYRRYMPLPVFHPVTTVLTLLPPALALLWGGSWPDVAWWCVTPAMSWLVWYIQRWDAHAFEELLGLECLRYDAKGA